jgi:hypothetical protein
MFLGHRPSYLRIGLQPEYNHRLNDPFRVGKMLRTVIFKRFEDLRIEAVRALDCLGLLRWLGFGISSWHGYSTFFFTSSINFIQMIKTYRLFNPDNTFQSKIAQSQRKDYTATAFYSSSKRFNRTQLIIPLTC